MITWQFSILCVKVMPDFKAVVVSSGSVFSYDCRCLALWIRPLKGSVGLAFDTFFSHDISLQHSLGLARYTVARFHTYMSPEVLPILAKPRLLKANLAQKIRPVTNVLFRKKWFYWGVHRAHISAFLTVHDTLFMIKFQFRCRHIHAHFLNLPNLVSGTLCNSLGTVLFRNIIS